MKEDIRSYVEAEMKRYLDGREQIISKRKAWKEFQESAEHLFSEYIDSVQELGYKYWLYQHSTPENKLSDFDHKYVTLFFGKDSTGLYELTNDEKPKIDHQGGCALHISQLVTGDVTVVFYPFKSELHVPNEEQLLYGIYSSPVKISKKKLDCLVKLLFCYARSTSYARNVDWRDRILVRWMRSRNWWYGRDKKGLVKNIVETSLGLIGAIKPPA